MQKSLYTKHAFANIKHANFQPQKVIVRTLTIPLCGWNGSNNRIERKTRWAEEKLRVEGGGGVQQSSHSTRQTNPVPATKRTREKKVHKAKQSSKSGRREKKNSVVQLGRCYQWRPHIRKTSGPLSAPMCFFIRGGTVAPLLFFCIFSCCRHFWPLALFVVERCWMKMGVPDYWMEQFVCGSGVMKSTQAPFDFW